MKFLMPLLVVLPILLAGCQNGQNNVLVEKNIEEKHRSQVIAVKADRRLIVFHRYKDKKTPAEIAEEKRTNVVVPEKEWSYFLAEPPPDAFSELATAVQLDAQVKAEAAAAGKFGETKVGGGFTFDKRTAENLVRLGVRTQGVILFRDASYRYGEAFINGAIKEDEYIAKLDTLVTVCAALSTHEITHNPTLSAQFEDKDGNKQLDAAVKTPSISKDKTADDPKDSEPASVDPKSKDK